MMKKPPAHQRLRPKVFALAVLVVALVCITWGALAGQAHDVYTKAALICFKCIGI